MLKQLVKWVRNAVRSAGFEIVRTGYVDPRPTDNDGRFLELIDKIRPFSMATKHRMAAMIDAVRYVALSKIEGGLLNAVFGAGPI